MCDVTQKVLVNMTSRGGVPYDSRRCCLFMLQLWKFYGVLTKNTVSW